MKELLKFLIPIICLFLISLQTDAQVEKAKLAWSLANTNKDYVQAASLADESIKNNLDFNTWYYRALVYYEIYSKTQTESEDPLARKQSLSSLDKAFELDSQKKIETNINSIRENIANISYNTASQFLNLKKYNVAFIHYSNFAETLILLHKENSDPDGFFYAGYSALMINNFDSATKYFKISIENGKEDENIYLLYSKSLWNIGEKEKSIKILERGHDLYPENEEINQMLISNYSLANKTVELEQKLISSIEKEPKNLSNYMLLSSIYLKSLGKSKEANEKFENIQKSILKINPNHFFANYNLGVLNYNYAVEIIFNMDYESDFLVLNKSQESSLQSFKLAEPYMLKAEELSPSNPNTLEALVGIYFALHEINKSNAYKNRLNLIKKK